MLRTKVSRIIAAFALCLCALPGADAATYYVATNGNDSAAGTQAAPFRSIQKGIDSATHGDTVQVGAGAFTGHGNVNINLKGKRITLRGTLAGAVPLTIIDCLGEPDVPIRGLQFASGETAETVVIGFSIRNGFINHFIGGGVGGGILIDGASPTIQNCTVSDCYAVNINASASGGGVYIRNGSPQFTDCTFNSNSVVAFDSSAFGGGVGVEGATSRPQFINCSIRENAVGSNVVASGGGLAAIFGADVTITGGSLANNSATATGLSAYGGGIVVTHPGTRLTMQGVTVRINLLSADKTFGGGLHAQNSSSLRLTDCTIADNVLLANTLGFGGGMSLIDSVSTSLERTTITGNQIDSQQDGTGGGITVANTATATLTDSTVSSNVNNSARYARGGGIATVLDSPTVTLARSVLANNLAQAPNQITGGGAYVETGRLNLFASTVSGNSALGSGNANAIGGGVCIVNGTVLDARGTRFLSNACIANGSGIGYGGALSCGLGTQVTLANCIVATNRTQAAYYGVGAGVYAQDSGTSVRLLQCTIVANQMQGVGQGTGQGGGLHVQDQAAVVGTNCIFYSNTAPFGAEFAVVNGGNFVGTYLCITGAGNVPDANHNFGLDPRFVRNPSLGADGQAATADDDWGDLHLQEGSPCLDRGNPAAPGLPGYDFDLNNRISGAAPDVGAYEFNSGPYLGLEQSLYVDKVAGNDLTGTGTQAAPFKTVTRALESVTSVFGISAIYIRQGNYTTDRPRTTKRVSYRNWTNTGEASIGKP
jgi:hypothetical protein